MACNVNYYIDKILNSVTEITDAAFLGCANLYVTELPEKRQQSVTIHSSIA